MLVFCIGSGAKLTLPLSVQPPNSGTGTILPVLADLTLAVLLIICMLWVFLGGAGVGVRKTSFRRELNEQHKNQGAGGRETCSSAGQYPGSTAEDTPPPL